jgi:hypothetical protein
VWREPAGAGLGVSLTDGESAFACARDVTMPVGIKKLPCFPYWGWDDGLVRSSIVQSRCWFFIPFLLDLIEPVPNV